MATVNTATTCGDPCKKIRLFFLCCISNSTIEVLDGPKKDNEEREEGEEEGGEEETEGGEEGETNDLWI